MSVKELKSLRTALRILAKSVLDGKPDYPPDDLAEYDIAQHLEMLTSNGFDVLISVRKNATEGSGKIVVHMKKQGKLFGG